jgi:hypothetical protein
MRKEGGYVRTAPVSFILTGYLQGSLNYAGIIEILYMHGEGI